MSLTTQTRTGRETGGSADAWPCARLEAAGGGVFKMVGVRDERSPPTLSAPARAPTKGTALSEVPLPPSPPPGGTFKPALRLRRGHTHSKVPEVARDPALHSGRGQFLDDTFCLLERSGYGAVYVSVLFPPFIFHILLSPLTSRS